MQDLAESRSLIDEDEGWTIVGFNRGHLTGKDTGQVSTVLRRGWKPHGTSKLSPSLQQKGQRKVGQTAR